MSLAEEVAMVGVLGAVLMAAAIWAFGRQD
jgi:hypothetical protein